MKALFERILFKVPYGLVSRFKIVLYRLLGAQLGNNNRFESGRCRRLNQIVVGHNNAFSFGYQLWPEDDEYAGKRIVIGNNNYFNRNLMLDACGCIEIGNGNMFGPDVYVTDSNHQYELGKSSKDLPMNIGKVVIGNNCWIGAKAIILKDVELGDNSVVAAGAVVTKSFPKGSIIGGVPAKLLKEHNDQ